MKRSRLFVLLFYHIPSRFTTKAAVNKPQQNRNSCCRNRNKPRILLPSQDIFVPFGFGMVGERLCLSKALSNFDISGRMLTSTKFLRVPVGQTFDRLRLALPVLGAPKGTETPKLHRYCWDYVSVPFGFCRETVKLPCLLIPAVKVYNGGKKFWRYQF